MTKEKKYKFGRNITNELKGFKSHLKGLGYNQNTIRQKSNYAGCFLEWIENEHLTPEDTRYNDLLSFIDYCRQGGGALSGAEGDSIKLINNKLRAARDYYLYLKKGSPSIISPALNLYVKGTPKKTISGTVGLDELETLYQSYPARIITDCRWAAFEQTETLRKKRNKVILGLFIYQGITTEELKRLEPGHLKLKEGKIYIPGGRRRNGRTLELKPFQIMELYEYVNETRPAIVKQIGFAGRSLGEGWKPTPCRKPERVNDKILENQLFISMGGSGDIKNSLLHLFRDIQKTWPGILHAKQIRASVIINWLKANNLRQVQYMAGHKYVSSTERYQLGNLEKLQEKLEKHHPLNTKSL